MQQSHVSTFTSTRGAQAVSSASVVGVVQNHPNGIAGERVIEVLVEQGLEAKDIRRAVRASIDRGDVETGRDMLLYPVSIAAE